MTTTTTTTSSASATATAPRAGARPGPAGLRPAGPVRASLSMAGRALRRIRHEPEQMADAIAVPIVFTVLFTYLFGGALAGSTHTYLRFLLPGTLVFAVLLVTVSTGLFLCSDKASGALDRFRSMPVWQPALVTGGLIADIVRYLIAAVLVLGLGLAMGYRPAGGAAGVLAAVALIMVFAFSLSWVWATLGLLLRSAQAVSVLSFAVQFPLTFASNAFVDPATLPGWLRAFVTANPVSHLVTAERGLMNGTAAASDIGWVLLASAALIAVFGPLTMRLYRSRR
ncbi:MAG TPA: ABC transporter permease [Streptosporangiaceae bacterium]|nr:ABC transporter permease [Streptosporangiaceae bacterium]